MIKQGDRVRVHPHGKPQEVAIGIVALASSNQRSIAIGFEDKPPFVILRDAMAIHESYGIMLFASRPEPWGPWVELFGGGHYEVEEIVRPFYGSEEAL